MIELLKTSLGRLRVIGFIEGVSLLIILFITMPLKYFYLIGDPNKIVGMFHGLLFFLYIYAVMHTAFELKWKPKIWLMAIVASIIPFGTFWADKKLFK
jgi:integral membrane protein